MLVTNGGIHLRGLAHGAVLQSDLALTSAIAVKSELRSVRAHVLKLRSCAYSPSERMCCTNELIRSSQRAVGNFMIIFDFGSRCGGE